MSQSPNENNNGQDENDKTTNEKDYIQLKVVGQDNSEVHFKIKHYTQLSKLKNAFCKRYGIKPQTVRFLYDGQKISDDATPANLEMESGDTIEVFQEQDGGF